MNWLCKALGRIGNDLSNIDRKMIISHYINNISNVIKITRPIRKWLVKFGNDNNIKTALVNHW